MIYLGISAYEIENRPHCYNCRIPGEGKWQFLFNFEEWENKDRYALFLCDACLNSMVELAVVVKEHPAIHDVKI